MTETLRRMQKKRAAGEDGFTLVELLVVVVIIGVLVAIAVPMYLNYRKGAANKSAESDVRGAVSAVEQFYTENGNAYPATGDNSGDKLIFGLTKSGDNTADGSTQTATLSPGNSLRYKNNGDGTYRLCGVNADGKTVYTYSSAAGGSVKKADNQDIKMDDCLAKG